MTIQIKVYDAWYKFMIYFYAHIVRTICIYMLYLMVTHKAWNFKGSDRLYKVAGSRICIDRDLKCDFRHKQSYILAD